MAPIPELGTLSNIPIVSALEGFHCIHSDFGEVWYSTVVIISCPVVCVLLYVSCCMCPVVCVLFYTTVLHYLMDHCSNRTLLSS